MKVREHLDQMVDGNKVDRFWDATKTLERRELKFRDRPGAPGTNLEFVKGRDSDDRLRRHMLLQVHKSERKDTSSEVDDYIR